MGVTFTPTKSGYQRVRLDGEEIGRVFQCSDGWAAVTPGGLRQDGHPTRAVAGRWLLGQHKDALDRVRRRLEDARQRAAAICLDAPPLIGVDARGFQCSETQQAVGLRARWDFTALCLHEGLSGVEAVLSGADPFHPERLLAAWWDWLYVSTAVASVAKHGMECLLRPARELVEAGMMSPYILPIVEGDGDVFGVERASGRAAIAKVCAEMRAARGEG